MCSDLVKHQSIHLRNPDINYIRLENCKYCKLEKRMNYRNRYRVNPRSNFNDFDFNIIREYSPYRYFNVSPIFEDVKVNTSLSCINKSTILELSKEEDFCSICQDTIKKGSIIRKINCSHFFHAECCDKWLETNKKCPTCRYNL
jgi:hypothetical protein